MRRGLIATMLANVLELRADKIGGRHPGDPALVQFLGLGRDNYAGVDVTEQSALSGTAFLQAVRILSEGIGMLPFHLYRRSENGGKDRAMEHPLYRVMRNRANPEQTAQEFRERQQAQAVVYGRSFAEIVRDRAGRVIELWPLRADKMRLVRKDRKRWWLYSLPDGTTAALQGNQVFQINGFAMAGQGGLGLLEVGNEAIAHSLAISHFGSSFFRNGALQRGFLQIKGRLSDDRQKAIEEKITERTGGLENMHRTMVLSDEANWVQTGVDPEHAQWIDSRKFSVLEISRLTNVKPHLLMDLERATFSNIEAQGEEHVRYTLNPWLTRWESRGDLDLLEESEQLEYFLEFKRDALLRGDTKSRFEAYHLALTDGWMNRNEVRIIENMNPVDGLDEFLAALNMGEATGTGTGTKKDTDSSSTPRAAGAPDELRSTLGSASRRSLADEMQRVRGLWRPVMLAAAERLVKREVREIRKAMKKYGEGSGLSGRGGQPTLESRQSGQIEVREFSRDFLTWVDEFYKEFPAEVRREMRGAVEGIMAETFETLRAELGSAEAWGASEEVLRDYLDHMGERWAGSGVGQIRDLIIAEEAERLLDERMGEWLVRRAEKVARRESAQAQGYASWQSMKSMGVLRMRWKNVGETCPLCIELDGKEMGIDEPFGRAGDVINPNRTGQDREADQKVSLKLVFDVHHPPLHDGCDCILVPA